MLKFWMKNICQILQTTVILTELFGILDSITNYSCLEIYRSYPKFMSTLLIIVHGDMVHIDYVYTRDEQGAWQIKVQNEVYNKVAWVNTLHWVQAPKGHVKVNEIRSIVVFSCDYVVYGILDPLRLFT